jgi:tRNA threonylcarbamoyladenosine biosynthesis protein TsaB
MKLLALDAATEQCSAALLIAGQLRWREARAERGHGEQLLAMIDGLLAEAGLTLAALDAIAFGRGPGAFTGVRLAASVTQGLAYSAGLPVIPVSGLCATAQQALQQPEAPPRVLVCQDARMGEVYWAYFERSDGHARAVSPERVAKPGQVVAQASHWAGLRGACGAGSGFGVCAALAVELPGLGPVFAGLAPHAREIATLAAHGGLAAALPAEQALPVYVRDDVAVVPGLS